MSESFPAADSPPPHDPRVAVIVPAYGAAQLLREAAYLLRRRAA